MIVNDRYQLQDCLGEGGMARVYRALDRTTGRSVAVKLPRQEYRVESEALERFRREVRALLNLSHPNIVQALDFGEHEGLPYLVMELVEGQDLRRRLLRQGALDQSEVVSIARQVLRALEYTHRQGIIHRDVSARNVLLEPDGRVRMTDFGIAHTLGNPTLTGAGTMLGSVMYIAPEQAQGREPVPQSDLYAVGVLLYEMLTGQLPFFSDNPVQLALKHVNQPPPKLPEHLDPRLRAIVERALEKAPERRFQTARAMEQALSALALDRTRPVPSPGPLAVEATLRRPAVPVRTYERPLALAGVLLLLMAAWLWLALWPGPHEPDPLPARQTIAERPAEPQLAERPAAEPEVAESPAAEPEVAESPAAEPEVAETPVAEPEVAETPVAEPEVAEETVAPEPELAEQPVEPEPEDSVVGGDPEPWVLNQRGYALMQQGRYAEAIPLLESAVAAYPPGSVDRVYGYALYNLGRSLRLSGQPEAAIPLLEERMRIPDQLATVRAELEAARRAAYEPASR